MVVHHGARVEQHLLAGVLDYGGLHLSVRRICYERGLPVEKDSGGCVIIDPVFPGTLKPAF